MKKFRKTGVIFLVLLLALSACGGAKTPVDYGDAAAFETALNRGENLEGKVVQFVIREVRPNTALGYNLIAGEHLNFLSSRNPDAKEGDTITVQVTTISSLLGSWIIQYEKVENPVVDSSTILSEAADGPENEPAAPANAAPSSSGSTADSASSTPLPLELADFGWYCYDASRDPAHVYYCGMIYNPNENLIGTFPKIIVTVKNGDGTILATDEHTGSLVMPGDTITLNSMFSMPTANISDDTKIYFDVECSDLKTSYTFYSNARTTDFEVSNISETNSSRESFITGEVTNNYFSAVDSVKITILLRKDGKIVYMDNVYVKNLAAGKSKAFQITSYDDFPEHDAIEASAMIW